MVATDNYQDEGHGHEILFLIGALWPVNPGENTNLRIREVKGFNLYTTTPINWGMGRAATNFYKRLTAMLSERDAAI